MPLQKIVIATCEGCGWSSYNKIPLDEAPSTIKAAREGLSRDTNGDMVLIDNKPFCVDCAYDYVMDKYGIYNRKVEYNGQTWTVEFISEIGNGSKDQVIVDLCRQVDTTCDECGRPGLPVTKFASEHGVPLSDVRLL